MLKMNPEIRDAWTAALRSGEFTQGYGRLINLAGDEQRRHCCLGVLCELAARQGIVDPAVRDDWSGGFRFEGLTSYPPIAVREWAGLTEKDPRVLRNGVSESLAFLNDYVQLNFVQIADLIDGGEGSNNA